jgi:hypothetical protein
VNDAGHAAEFREAFDGATVGRRKVSSRDDGGAFDGGVRKLGRREASTIGSVGGQGAEEGGEESGKECSHRRVRGYHSGTISGVSRAGPDGAWDCRLGKGFEALAWAVPKVGRAGFEFLMAKIFKDFG